MNQKSSLGLVVAIVLSVTGLAQGQVAAGNAGAGLGGGPVYVEDFATGTALTASTSQDASSSQDTSAGSQTSRQVAKVAKNASALSEALVRELNAKGISAYRLTLQDPVPAAGWVVTGVFSERVPHGLFSGFAALGSSKPNTEVTMNIADLGAPAAKPVAVLNTDAQLTGQGSALDFNPYLIAAKAVAHRVESSHSIDDLAKRLADQIVAQRSGKPAGI